MSNNFYSDINLNFKPHPSTGDITFLSNENAVKRAMVHIGEMIPYDIPFEPKLHGHIRQILFELPTAATENALSKNIEWAIKKMEPRAIIDDISVTPTNNESAYHVVVKFTVISILDEQTIDFYLERIR